MKKITSSLLLCSLAIGTAFANDDNCTEYNTIKYSTQAQTTVKSDSILVQVTGYATTNLQDQNSVEKEISDQVNNVVTADWKVKNLEQNKSKSGALNITVQLEARISQQDLNKLQKVLDNQQANGKKLEVEVLDYNPPIQEIQKAKQKLMIQIYQQAKEYLQTFNKETHGNYLIQSVKYNDASTTYRPKNTVMLMRSASNEMDSTVANPVAVSQDVKIDANITFMER